MAGGRTSEKLTKRAVDAAQPQAKRYWLRDGELRGFAVRVLPSGVKTYVAVYRAGTGRGAPQREYTIGQHGEVTLDQAREEARRVLGAARLGGDPQGERVGKRSELTVAQLCDLYLTEGVATKKASTLATDRGRITTHIKPLLGKKHISSVTSGDVERFMRDVAQGKTATEPTKVRPGVISHVRGGKGTASRTVGLLGGIFSFAVRHKLRPDNPVRGVTRYKDGRSERFLSAKELARLGEAITKAAADGSNTKGLAVIRLLTTTGARKSEIEGLRWDEIDFEQSALRLRDSKTGAKVIAIGAPALSLLAELAAETRSRQVKAEVEANAAGQPNPVPSPWVFPAGRGSAGHWVGTAKVWTAIRAKADLADVRLHDLRHTYASLAVGASGGGQSLAVIGKLLGHADVRTTARYAHLADDPVRQAANRIAEAAAAGLAGTSAKVVDIRKGRRARRR
ncbi:MAG: tyrosine-type recombinase/integrase [Novosphingobium sp.]|nr:tyrosine-type recombinase/integrase [Novosphingobium sp.]